MWRLDGFLQNDAREQIQKQQRQVDVGPRLFTKAVCSSKPNSEDRIYLCFDFIALYMTSILLENKNHSNDPLVTFLVPSYNHEQYVVACVRSVIEQDYPNIELIIIDDGSNDSSVRTIHRMAEACKRRFVRFEFRSRENQGLSATINEALKWSNGKYFSALASDDVLRPNKTSVLISQIEGEENVAGVFSGCEVISHSGSVVKLLRPPPAYHTFDDILFCKHGVITPSQLLRLDLVREAGGYPKDIYIEDWYMWLALTQRGFKLKVISDPLVQYRQHASNSSKDALWMYEGRKSVLSYFKDHPGYEFVLAEVCAMAAIDFASVSKRMSSRFLIEAVTYNGDVIYSPIFAKAFARLLAPVALIEYLRRLRGQTL